jgi:uncharacterized protein (DUF934 family)
MRLVKDGRIVDDPYVRILDDSAIPDDEAALVPVARLLADSGELSQRSGPTGVLWPNDRSVSELAPHLDRLSLVALAFPSFKDGRAYSQARLLCERYHFRGELRATGQVLRDQFVFLLRAGFNSFEVTKPDDAAAFLETIGRYSVFYQPAEAARRTRRRSTTSLKF